jgi:hypothetical protein
MSGFGGHAAAAPHRVDAHDRVALRALGAATQPADPLTGLAVMALTGRRQHR